MPRSGNAASRGYGHAHRRRTAELKGAMRDGQPCARGGEPLYRWQLTLPRADPRSLEGDHVATPRALGPRDTPNLPDALSCAHHNRQHGARLGNRLRGASRRAARTGRTRAHPRAAAPAPDPQRLPRW